MRAVGFATEYNPFHNGHLHHLRESLRGSGADVAVAVMSGHFLQRGEPALVDKWVRAEMALRAGVDVVLELPFPFACNSAPHFALGAVKSLEALGGVTDLCFGSEGGDLTALERCASVLLERADDVGEGTAEALRRGVSYPAARVALLAHAEEIGDREILATPNNILGIAYLLALRRIGSTVVPHAIPRIGAGYHQEEPVETIASATGIRRMLERGGDVSPFLPDPLRPLLESALAAGHTCDYDALHRLLLARILRGAESLRTLYLVEDGIAERLYAAAATSRSWEDLVGRIKMRQFTRTRIQRTLCHVLNESDAVEMNQFLSSGPLYLRLLAASGRGHAFLGATRKKRLLPLISNVSRFRAQLKKHYGGDGQGARLAYRMFQCDLQASRLHTVLMRRWEGDRNRDFYEEARS